MKKVVILGPSGAGKTTLAGQLAERFNMHHIELDSLHWGPGWSERPKDEFLADLAREMAHESWVVDGNYSFARELIWPEADTAVWLDYPLSVILWRLLSRTLRRTVGRQALWNGNRERFWVQFLSKESLFLWAVKSQAKHRRRYPPLFASELYAHIQLIHHHRPAETRQWLAAISDRPK